MTYDASTRRFKLVNANNSTVTSTALPLATSTVAGLMLPEHFDILNERDFASIDEVSYTSTNEGANLAIWETSNNEIGHVSTEVAIPLASSEENGLLKKELSEDVDILNGLAYAMREAMGAVGDMAVGKISLLPGDGLSLATDPYSDNEE